MKVLVFLLLIFSFAFGDLQMVHVLFRHGNKSPQSIPHVYPNDPYGNLTYWPYGYGGLTNEGKRTMYSLGKNLRLRYNNFLGSIYSPDILYARTTNSERTKNSLQMVLAGLFPPKSVNIWNYFLNWQPIPYDFKDIKQDCLLYANGSITEFFNYFDEKSDFSKWKDIFDYISRESGGNITSPNVAALLFLTLENQQEWGLILPQWTKKVYPEPLNTISKTAFQTFGRIKENQKFISGNLIGKIIQDTMNKINDKETKKIYLYSAHDINMQVFLQSLGVSDMDIPYYGSNIILEVHRRSGIFGFELYHQKNVHGPRFLLIIPGCRKFCPIGDFVAITKDIVENNCKD